MLLLVMCELGSPATLAPLRQAIEAHGPSCHFFDSFFLVATDKSPLDLQRTLRVRIGGQAAVYVSRLAHQHTDYLPREIRDWIVTHRDPDTHKRPVD